MASLGHLLCVLALLLCGPPSTGLSRPHKRGPKKPIIGKEARDHGEDALRVGTGVDKGQPAKLSLLRRGVRIPDARCFSSKQSGVGPVNFRKHTAQSKSGFEASAFERKEF